MMPIPIVKALLQGKPPERHLFLPMIFSLTAKLEDIPLSTFVNNPTKIANNLVALYRRLRPDGVTCYYDRYIVAEALGCKVDWSIGGPQLESPDRNAALNMLQQ